jgi:hypothetical protein
MGQNLKVLGLTSGVDMKIGDLRSQKECKQRAAGLSSRILRRRRIVPFVACQCRYDQCRVFALPDATIFFSVPIYNFANEHPEFATKDMMRFYPCWRMGTLIQ